MAEGGESIDLDADLIATRLSRKTFQEKLDTVKRGRCSVKMCIPVKKGFIATFKLLTTNRVSTKHFYVLLDLYAFSPFYLVHINNINNLNWQIFCKFCYFSMNSVCVCVKRVSMTLLVCVLLWLRCLVSRLVKAHSCRVAGLNTFCNTLTPFYFSEIMPLCDG